MRNPSEFYVGYLPMPSGLKRRMRRVGGALAGIVTAAALLLVAGQHPFPASTFEFQQYRDFQGLLMAKPYPALLIPGEGRPWLLVAPGKHGADALVRGLDGSQATLRGSRILRGEDHMIELLPGSVRAGAAQPASEALELGTVEWTGEIVDSKCYFGVMNPGNGKVHRDCAVRCISGGIPPALLVRDADGHAGTVLLANWKRSMLDHVAEPVRVRGRLKRAEGQLVLQME